MINKSILELYKKKYLVSNLVSFIDNKKDFQDKNIIKIIKNNLNEAIFFKTVKFHT